MSKEVAETILSQLGGSGKLKAMLGASSFSSGAFPNGYGLSFRIKAKAKGGTKAIIITLTGKDLYDVRLMKMKGFDVVDVANGVDIGAEQLKPWLEDKLGLRLSF